MENEKPDAGWYRDPVDPSRYRYWDGAGWTHQVRSPEPSTALAVVRPEPVVRPAPVVPTPVPTPVATPAAAPAASVVSEVAGLYADDDAESAAKKVKGRKAEKAKAEKAKAEKAKAEKAKAEKAKAEKAKAEKSRESRKVEKLKGEREFPRQKVLAAVAVIGLAAIGVTAALTYFGGAEEGGATDSATDSDFAAGPARNACIRVLKDSIPGSQNQMEWQPIEGVTHRQVGDQVQIEFWGDETGEEGGDRRTTYLCIVDPADVTSVQGVYVRADDLAAG